MKQPLLLDKTEENTVVLDAYPVSIAVPIQEDLPDLSRRPMSPASAEMEGSCLVCYEKLQDQPGVSEENVTRHLVCCGKSFHHGCLQKWLQTDPYHRCPYCNVVIQRLAYINYSAIHETASNSSPAQIRHIIHHPVVIRRDQNSSRGSNYCGCLCLILIVLYFVFILCMMFIL